ARCSGPRWADLQTFLPVLKNTPVGFAGMFYMGVDDLQGVRDGIAQHTEIVKDISSDHTGQRMFYFRDIDGYVIGVNEKAALEASALSKYA
ncbi:VOC family protein, partial [Streptomyces sp. ISL-100]|uniref:VOC family protein n=1 Tax=Streptomyces sp. ISL-100 TaxID=2819173 RepID=UPI001C197659|nr:VOC family protein [Streptomyces sp. ISL-100]